MLITICLCALLLLSGLHRRAYAGSISEFDVVWHTPSQNSSESMPCGGGDIGCNVWVEDGDLLMLVDRSGNIDENDQQLKSGCLRIRLNPNPFPNSSQVSAEGFDDAHLPSNLCDGAIGERKKWFVKKKQAWVQFKLMHEARLDGYTITSAEDMPQRDPSRWTLKGSQDAQSWTVVDEQSDIKYADRNQQLRFHVPKPESFRFYRFEFQNSGGEELQIAEIGLFENDLPLITPANTMPAGYWFEQRLDLAQGCVRIKAESPLIKAEMSIWVEVHRPVVRIEATTDRPSRMQADYECWRNETRDIPRTLDAEGKKDSWDYNRWQMFGYFWYDGEVKSYPDKVEFEEGSQVVFAHRNRSDDLIFDKEVALMRMKSVAAKLAHPTKNRIFGGCLLGDGLRSDGIHRGISFGIPVIAHRLSSAAPRKKHQLRLCLHTKQTPKLEQWRQKLQLLVQSTERDAAASRQKSVNWWKEFWNRSQIGINPGKGASDEGWQIARNYNLMRYMLACNLNGELPTRFNGGLFTFDSQMVDGRKGPATNPDFRAWGAWTAQNQRLVYWPMLKSGDVDVIRPQFEFYRKNRINAEQRNRVAWGIPGCSFCEQIGSGGLPLGSHYGWEPPHGTRDPKKEVGLSDLHATYYTSQLEFAFMMHEWYRHTGADISSYLPFMKQAVEFHFSYFTMLHKRKTGKLYDDQGKLVIDPSHALETYHGKNSTDVICALLVNLKGLLALPAKWVSETERKQYIDWLERLPPINFREREGHHTISPMAGELGPITNYEAPQLYPVFPYGLYGIGMPDLQVAIDTWKYGLDPWTIGRKPEDAPWNPAKELWYGWTQQAIWLARMGLTTEAKEYLVKKLCDARVGNDFSSTSRMRFPAFWGPGFDWTPDHNWGGSGMIALQEMLMQTPDERIFILPAWPKEWDVKFKLHAPGNTTVEVELEKGVIKQLRVTPSKRAKDVVLPEGLTLG